MVGCPPAPPRSRRHARTRTLRGALRAARRRD